MKSIKLLIIIIVIVGAVGVIGLFGAKQTLEKKKKKKVAAMIDENAQQEDLQTKLVNTTRFAYKQYKTAEKKDSKSPVALMKQVLNCKKLPAFLRLSEEMKDVFGLQAGSEESAAHFLVYLLKQQELESGIWTIISPKATKLAVGVKVDAGGYKYLDPASGVVAMYQDKIMVGPYAARYLMVDGADYQQVFVKLDENSDISFYKDFAHTVMAPPDMPLYVNLAAPVFDEPLVLGAVDGQSQDVAEASEEVQLTAYIDYIGQKHGGNVHRSFYFTDATKMTMILTKNYTLGILDANIEPQVEGNKLVFNIPEGEKLTLEDLPGAYIPVDQIIIERL